jgi:hypothetical protein
MRRTQLLLYPEGEKYHKKNGQGLKKFIQWEGQVSQEVGIHSSILTTLRETAEN